MILSDRDLRAALDDGRIVVDPLGPGAVQPASIDVRLGTEGIRLQAHKEGEWELYPFYGPEFTFWPGEFALGCTMEFVTVPDDLLCHVVGRSSVGRTGLQVECAGLVDPGWERGQITLELSNLGHWAIELYAGMPIAQLTFQQLSSPAERPYGSPGVGRYQGQAGPTPARALRGLS